ncbi:recombination regulator RecX [Pandoraea communis]|uniref:Regulatory protein RecX n=1 Tax=Pandoraea communis TaxID=2508297 RepID=A0A5E4W9P8_9BURK|nr:recombination regulator RecX [Pandoraea communis]EON15557.1 regulatory protein [Pandoraea sp. SD6-2]VVE19805.1 recombinase RecX [Pandoraea communis]
MINRRPPRDSNAPPPPPGDEAVSVKRSRKPVLSLKARALSYLARREYSRTELRRKLVPFADAEDPEALDRVLDTLEQERWLSNERFAESVVNRRASRLGTTRIVNELKQHQVDAETVAALTEQLRGTELARARVVWQKKFGEVATTPEARAKQMRFLASRGFSRTVISKIVRGADEFSDDF